MAFPTSEFVLHYARASHEHNTTFLSGIVVNFSKSDCRGRGAILPDEKYRFPEETLLYFFSDNVIDTIDEIHLEQKVWFKYVKTPNERYGPDMLICIKLNMPSVH